MEGWTDMANERGIEREVGAKKATIMKSENDERKEIRKSPPLLRHNQIE